MITITYCKPCGYVTRAARIQHVLHERLGLESELIPGKGGIFEVKWGDEVIAKKAARHFPDEEEVVNAVAAQLTSRSGERGASE